MPDQYLKEKQSKREGKLAGPTKMQSENKRVALARGGTVEGLGFWNRSHVRLCSKHNPKPSLWRSTRSLNPDLVNTRGGKSEAAPGCLG